MARVRVRVMVHHDTRVPEPDDVRDILARLSPEQWIWMTAVGAPLLEHDRPTTWADAWRILRAADPPPPPGVVPDNPDPTLAALPFPQLRDRG